MIVFVEGHSQLGTKQKLIKYKILMRRRRLQIITWCGMEKTLKLTSWSNRIWECYCQGFFWVDFTAKK